MLKVTIPESELFDSKRGEFIITKECSLQLEHSLYSIAKWESKWKKPYLSSTAMSYEETIDYIRFMTVTPKHVDPNWYYCLTSDSILSIQAYINDPMTATTIKDVKKGSREIITNEVIYYWMICNQIPFECDKWHFNRLMTLIKVCNIKNTPSKKMSRKDVYAQNRALNEARKAKNKTRG